MQANQPVAESTSRARKDRVIRSVLHMIFRGELVGGDRLVEEDVGAKLGVSRTPIREALRDLAALGTIWLKPNHGAVVRPFGPPQLKDIYFIRRVLESEATRLACGSINPIELRAIREQMVALIGIDDHSGDWSVRALALDGQLHDMIARSSGSDRLVQEIRRYWALAYTIGEAVKNVSHTQDHAIREHIDIIDCLLAGNAEAAGAAMANHIDMRLGVALEALCPAVRSARAPVTEFAPAMLESPIG